MSQEQNYDNLSYDELLKMAGYCKDLDIQAMRSVKKRKPPTIQTMILERQ